LLDKSSGIRIRISMRGPFRIEDANGAEITPQLRKSRGLIALLATSENHYRTRAWIQNKLWSDRAPEQAASSLRQSLADIRRHLGDLRDIVIADRTGVALNPDAVELIDMPNGTDTTARLFEGLGIRDTAFEGWLAELRARDPVAQRHLKNGAELHAPQGVKRFDQPLRQIVFHAENETGGQLGFIETALIELTVRSLREQTDVEVYFNPPDMLRADAIMVEVQCYPLSGGAFGLRSSVQAVANGDMQWTGAARIEAAPDAGQTPASLSVASAQLANGVLSSLVRPHQSAPAHEDMDANLLASEQFAGPDGRGQLCDGLQTQRTGGRASGAAGCCGQSGQCDGVVGAGAYPTLQRAARGLLSILPARAAAGPWDEPASSGILWPHGRSAAVVPEHGNPAP